MQCRQPIRRPLPRLWLMTDPRFGDRLLRAIQKLPTGSGVVFRHYELDAGTRKALFDQVRRICARRGHIVLLAGNQQRWAADGIHGPMEHEIPRTGIRSCSVHSLKEIAVARCARADLLFVSPVYATRSHVGQRPLGPQRFRRLAALAHPIPVIALGGMTHARAAMWPRNFVHGWAAIDALI
jgi:thiamine-phosphate pyrophosphorylase